MSNPEIGAATTMKSEFTRKVSGVYTRDISYGYFVPAGVPGVVTRLDTPPVIETQVFDSAHMPGAFGLVVLTDATTGLVRAVTSSDTSYSVMSFGFLVRPYPTQQNSTTGATGSGAPNSASLANLMKRGYMIVSLQNATAAVKGAQVYYRTTVSGQLVLGGIEAGSSGTTAITNCYFTGAADSSGFVEVAFNI